MPRRTRLVMPPFSARSPPRPSAPDALATQAPVTAERAPDTYRLEPNVVGMAASRSPHADVGVESFGTTSNAEPEPPHKLPGDDTEAASDRANDAPAGKHRRSTITDDMQRPPDEWLPPAPRAPPRRRAARQPGDREDG
jgi:hypothetical protein